MTNPYRGVIELNDIQQSDDFTKWKRLVYDWNVRHCRFRFGTIPGEDELYPAVAWAREGLVLLQRALVVEEDGETLVRVEGTLISNADSDVLTYTAFLLPEQPPVRKVYYLDALHWEGDGTGTVSPSVGSANNILYSSEYRFPAPSTDYGVNPIPVFLSHWLDFDAGENPNLIPFTDTRIDTNYDLLGTILTDQNTEKYVAVRPYLKNGVTDGSYDTIYVPRWSRDRVWYLGDTSRDWDWEALKSQMTITWGKNIVDGLGTFSGYQFGPLFDASLIAISPRYLADDRPGDPDDLMVKFSDGVIMIRTDIGIPGTDQFALLDLETGEIIPDNANQSEALRAFALVHTYDPIDDYQIRSDILQRFSEKNSLIAWGEVIRRSRALEDLAQLPPPTTEPEPLPPLPEPTPIPEDPTIPQLLVLISQKDRKIAELDRLATNQQAQLEAQARQIEELLDRLGGIPPGPPPQIPVVSEEEERLMRIVKAANEEINILSRRISKLKDERVDPAVPTEEETRLRNQLRGKFELVRRNNAKLARIRKHPVAGSGNFPNNFLFGRTDEFGEAVLKKYGITSLTGWRPTTTSPKFSMSFYEEESGLSYAVMTASDIPFRRVDITGISASFYRFDVTKSNNAWQEGVAIEGNSLRLSDFPLSGTLSVHLDRTATTSGYLISPGDIPKGGLLQLYTGVGNRGPIFSPPVTAAGISNVIGGTLQITLRKTPRDTVELIGVTFVLVADKL